MTTTASADSASIKHGCPAFTAARLVHSFPRYDTVKQSLLEGTLFALPRFVQLPDGSLVSNPDASAFLQ